MTVRELISELMKVTNIDAPVSAFVGYAGYGTIAAIEDVTDLKICICLDVDKDDTEAFFKTMNTLEEDPAEGTCPFMEKKEA